MPTYSYACTECGHRFDAQQSFDDAALTECPECAGRLRKLFGAVGVVFKGPGFYRTDSRAGNGATKRGAASNGSPTRSPSTSGATTGSTTRAEPAAGGSSAPAAAAASG